MSSLGIVLLLIIFIFIVDYPNIFIPVILVIGGILFIKSTRAYNQLTDKEKKTIKAKDRVWRKYNEIKSMINFPIETHIVHYIKGDSNILKGSLHMWVQDKNLCFFPFIASIDGANSISMDIEKNIFLLQIAIDDIEYYSIKSDKFTVLVYAVKGEKHFMFFTKRDYVVFENLLPGKAYSYLDKKNY
ncbi:hypothetical protein EDD65_10450 [Keratinibaculum paraultunense]|uniref:Uncharacterized protein n=1 Tax=Keratinibaculum paraultunense TaxID=1278232 RepID=A0A4R3KXE9_9FIRM|nr:hypothetical protein [Keratinibaculum paraultunense]QQY78897.1 hypothetical protein JL105_06765 [Keratinibaculum paraultunense]TCS90509.1 hypothetical protein EDD65_10450 [Keratinibaculum paraultunense]